VFLYELPRKLPDIFRLVFVKAGRVDQLFQSAQGFLVKIFGVLKFREQSGRDLIDLLVGTLGTENDRYDQFVRVGIAERGPDGTELPFEAAINFAGEFTDPGEVLEGWLRRAPAFRFRGNQALPVRIRP
jgi:hypothetical protein